MSTKSKHSLTAEAYAFGRYQFNLEPTQARISVDEGWSPYVQASLELPLMSTADLQKIDPRNDARVRLNVRADYGNDASFDAINVEYAGKTFTQVNALMAGMSFDDLTRAKHAPYNASGYRAAQSMTVDVGVRAWEIDYEAKTVSIELESDEALLHDFVRVDPVFTPAGTNVLTAVREALGAIGARLTTEMSATVEAASLVWKPGTSAWDYIEAPLQAANIRLYCDENRKWHMVPASHDADGLLVLSTDYTITQARQTVSRDSNWFDAVIIEYNWTDAFDLVRTEHDKATTPGYSKVLKLEFKTPYPGAGAAQGVLDRATGRGQVFDVSAVSDYTARPGTALALSVLDDTVQSGTISAVTWELPSAEMTVKSRGLIDTAETAWLLASPGLAWNEIPAGMAWDEYPINS